MVALQNAVTDEQTPVAMALLIFSQNFLGATLLIVATALFDSSLKRKVAKYSPSVPYSSVLAAGANPVHFEHSYQVAVPNWMDYCLRTRTVSTRSFT